MQCAADVNVLVVKMFDLDKAKESREFCVETANTAHKGEWRDNSKLVYFCALGDLNSWEGSKFKCVHGRGVVRGSHWSCCGSNNIYLIEY